MHYLRYFTVFILTVMSFQPAAAQQVFLEKLLADIQAARQSQVEAACTPGFWKRESGNSAAHFYRQITAKPQVLELRISQPLMTGSNRAVGIVDLYSTARGRVVDQVFFYLEKQGETWKWSGIDENKALVVYFLDGRLPAGFSLNSSSPLPELARWGQDWAAKDKQAADTEQRVITLNSVLAGPHRLTAQDLYQVMALQELSYQTNYWVGAISRGAVVFWGKDPEYPDYPGEVVIYLQKTQKGWQWMGTSAFPSSSLILEEEY